MGRLFRASFKLVTGTVQQDFFEIYAMTGTVVKIHDWWLGQTSEIADAQEEQLLIITNRGVGATSGSGGTTVTPVPLENGDSAFRGVVEANNTTKMTGGTVSEVGVYQWNVRTPFPMVYTPETMPLISGNHRWTIELETTPADAITFNGTVTFEEIG